MPGNVMGLHELLYTFAIFLIEQCFWSSNAPLNQTSIC